ncbi:hypothetical protein OS493_005886 [Desmophyllum pertusum]|uniref:MANSC domain-containing protein n=1 Tax=Desmophyllum pertusum TaxID=174260 RepID=A0A9X0CHW5_9CNID|nr:hypothetical protein OS493_005886 [Desmophyllum pertusum]
MKYNKQVALWSFVFITLWTVLQTQTNSGSPRRCIAETAQYNVTFLKGISTGKFQHLGEVANMSECSKLACSLSEGDMAYLLEDRCFSVECYTTCDLIKLPHADAVNSAAARLRRSGKNPIPVTPDDSTTVSATMTTTTVQPEIDPTSEPPRVKPGEVGPDKKIAKSAEHRLLQDLIYSDSYNREVRPALVDKDVVKIAFSLKLVQIVDVVRLSLLRYFIIKKPIVGIITEF